MLATSDGDNMYIIPPSSISKIQLYRMLPEKCIKLLIGGLFVKIRILKHYLLIEWIYFRTFKHYLNEKQLK